MMPQIFKDEAGALQPGIGSEPGDQRWIAHDLGYLMQAADSRAPGMWRLQAGRKGLCGEMTSQIGHI